MVEFGSRDRARSLAEQLDAAIAFADEHEDFVLGAKLADAQAHLHDHYIRLPRKEREKKDLP